MLGAGLVTMFSVSVLECSKKTRSSPGRPPTALSEPEAVGSGAGVGGHHRRAFKRHRLGSPSRW